MYLTQENPTAPIGRTDVPHPAAGDDIAQYRANRLFRQPRTAGHSQNGTWAWQSGWQDSVAWFVCGMFAFLNLPIAGGLTKLAYKK